MNVPHFVVSIERNRQRCDKTVASLAAEGIEATPWWGVDGTQPIEFQDGESVDYSSRTYHAKRGRSIPSTTVGGYLSHYRLMKHVLEQGWEKIVVFEDDAIPLQGMKQHLSEILELDSSFHYINLLPAHLPSSLHEGWDKFWHTLPSGRQVIFSTSRALGMVGYVINVSSIQKLVPRLMPISDDVDVAMESLLFADQKPGFSVWPPLLTHEGPNLIDRGPYGPHHRAQRWFTRISHRQLYADYKKQRHQLEAKLSSNLTEKTQEAEDTKKVKDTLHPVFMIVTTKRRPSEYLLKHQGSNLQEWSGIDSDDLKLNQGESVGSTAWFYRQYGRSIKRAEIAHYVSHYRLLKYALDNNLERITILEPEALPIPSFGEIVDAISELNDSYEFVALHTSRIPSAIKEGHHELLQPVYTDYSLLPALDGIDDTIAYSVSLSGLRKIVPQLMPISANISTSLAHMLWTKNVRGYTIWPQVVFKHPYAFNPGWKPYAPRNPFLKLTRASAHTLIRKVATAFTNEEKYPHSNT